MEPSIQQVYTWKYEQLIRLKEENNTMPTKAFGAMKARERNKLKGIIKRHKECLKWASHFGLSKEELKNSFRNEVANSFYIQFSGYSGC